MAKRSISLLLLLCLLACLSGCESVVLPGADGTAWGEPGNRMRTACFDFIVHTAAEAADYEGVRPGPGEKLVLLDITVYNTSGGELDVYDTDFHLLWGENGYADTIGTAHSDMAPPCITLAAQEKARYLYAYAVPADAHDFRLCFLDTVITGTSAASSLFCVTFSTG